MLPQSVAYSTSDNSPMLCKAGNNDATLPRDARLPINRCNLPAVILGSLTFQRHPAPLRIDGVHEFHRELFDKLDAEADASRRPELFRDYLTVHFRFEHLEDAGFDSSRKKHRSRAKATYARMIRGWSFDSNGAEGAVLKAWVESRFGLIPRYHGGALGREGDKKNDAGWLRYMEMRRQGLYGANALEAQLDLVYTYCQYEFARQHPKRQRLMLYRGVNRLGEHDTLETGRHGHRIVLFNNLNSFSNSRERASEFGDYILQVDVPVSKVFFHQSLLPGLLQGEDELLVIGGVYAVESAVF